MSILINLLPDIRQAKLRERRRRQLVSGVSVMVWAVCGGIIVLLTVYATGQKVLIAGLSDSITKKQNELKKIDKLPEALTAADHLASLPSLYDKRQYFTKFFERYSQSNPQDITLNSMEIDAHGALGVNGSAKTYAAVAKLARTLEASNVLVGKDKKSGNTPYFKDVVISNVSADNIGVSFTIRAVLNEGVTADTKKVDETSGGTNGN